MSERQTRRSFLTKLLTRVAGGWLLLAGGAGLASGCGEATKYGGPPDLLDEDAGEPVAKYGGPVEDAGVDEEADAAVKYGGPDAGF